MADVISVRARHVSEDRMHEVRCEDGRYTSVVYLRDPELDRELTADEAMVFIDALRKCNGTDGRARSVRR